MPILITDEDDGTDKLSQQAISFALHTLLAIGAWILLMLAGYAINPVSVSQVIVLLLSIVVPMLAGQRGGAFSPRRDGDARVAGGPDLAADRQLVGARYAHGAERVLPVRRNREADADVLQPAPAQRAHRRQWSLLRNVACGCAAGVFDRGAACAEEAAG